MDAYSTLPYSIVPFPHSAWVDGSAHTYHTTYSGGREGFRNLKTKNKKTQVSFVHSYIIEYWIPSVGVCVGGGRGGERVLYLGVQGQGQGQGQGRG